MDTKAFYKMTYGLYIVSTRYGEKDFGCIVNTLEQITSSPAQMSVTINKENYTAKMIDKSGYFCATPLTVDAPMELIANFGFKSGKDFDKFANQSFDRDEKGVAYVNAHTNALFCVRVTKTVDVGTHNIYIGEVVDCKPLSSDESMTYAYYQTVKKGTTPPKAPSFNKAKAEPAQPAAKKARWVCKICGYVYDGDPIPEDFICPVCAHTAKDFERVVS